MEGAAATVAPKMNSKLVRERRQRDGHIAWLEDCVVEYLELSAAQTQTREHAQKFLAAVDAKAAADVRFRLSAFEKMQLVNHRPSGRLYRPVDDALIQLSEIQRARGDS